MSSTARRGRITPGEMFPAGEAGYRVNSVPLPSGLRVRVVERGPTNGFPVVMLPGWGSSVYLWSHNLPAVADAGYRAIAVDLKGNGLSDKPTGERHYTSDAMVAHIAEILAALALDNPVLVGHSQAAAIAMRYAKKNVVGVRALVLVSPVGHAGVKFFTAYKFLTPRFLRGILPSLCSRLAIRITLSRVYGKLRRFTERDVDEFWAPCQFREFSISQRDALHAFDWKEPVTGSLNTPTLILHGTADHLVRGDSLDVCREVIRDVEIVAIEGAGHVVPLEADAEMNAALITFLQRVTAAGYIAH